MKWAEFLKKIADAERVTLIGPLQSEKFTPTLPTIYVDGGVTFAGDAVDIPVVSVGDGDSGAAVLDQLLPPEKDYSDLAFVLRAIPQSIGHVEMRGFMGGRRDHEYCNLGEVHAFLAHRSHFTTVELWGTDTKIIGVCKGRVSMELNGVFSVLVMEPAAVKITGACKYPLNRERVLPPFSSVGLSNEGYGLVEIESGPPAFVIVPTT